MPAAPAQQTPASKVKPLDALLEEIHAEFHLPALAAGIVTPMGLQENDCVGVRKQGDATPVTNDDLRHLGSYTNSGLANAAQALDKTVSQLIATRFGKQQ